MAGYRGPGLWNPGLCPWQLPGQGIPREVAPVVG